MNSLTPEHEPLEEEEQSDTSKTRQCLMCGDKFESAWAGERICRRCRGSKAWRTGDSA